MGKFYDRKKIKSKNEISKNYTSILDFIWLEITKNCNLKCLHCYSESHPGKTYNTKMGLKDWGRVLKEANQLGCKKVQLIGGEPFLFGENIFSIIDMAKSLRYKFIEVFTNGTLLNEYRINLLKKYSVHVAISLYGYTSKTHDQITRSKGSFLKTLQNITILRENDIPVRIALVTMKQNQDILAETIEFLEKEIGIDNIKYDFVRPSGRGCDPTLFPDRFSEVQMIRSPKFLKISKDVFFQRRSGHNCFARKLCVTSSGDVMPCIMERDIIVGNVKENSLKHILSKEETNKVRNISKDYIEVCRDCEYRYTCFDCRPTAKALADGNLYAKPNWCSYDPYEGEWG